jgi:hypothetical protein
MFLDVRNLSKTSRLPRHRAISGEKTAVNTSRLSSALLLPTETALKNHARVEADQCAKEKAVLRVV